MIVLQSLIIFLLCQFSVMIDEIVTLTFLYSHADSLNSVLEYHFNINLT